jgi:flagellar protein FlgJ
MLERADLTSQMALDVQGLNRLKVDSKAPSKETLKAAAQQFEALFMNMMLKSMRDATPQDGITDSEQTRMYTSMLDQQLSLKLSSRGIGLADLMVKQLGKTLSADAVSPDSTTPDVLSPAAIMPSTVTPALSNPVQSSVGNDPSQTVPVSNQPAHVSEFNQKLMQIGRASCRERVS